jgi:Lon protease-like protein
MKSDLSALDQFNGIARLFPLPNLVQFPHVIQPLHIFEPRYREMTADALAGDRLLAMALLRPGWESNYEGKPAIYPVACLGKIVADQRLADGRYNLLLQGLSRARILEELDSGRPYRTARVELLAELPPADAAVEQRLRAQLDELLPRWFPVPAPMLESLRKLLQTELPLGMLGDIVASALPLEPAFKQQLLESLSVEARLRELLGRLASEEPTTTGAVSLPPADGSGKFPPDFSDN